MRLIIALVSGLLFGLGLVISEMVNPQRVQAFMDFFGDWDPTLAFVMGGAMSVSAFSWFVASKRTAPLFGGTLPAPAGKVIDKKLVIGSALFGVGWGLVGICPGAGIAALSFGAWQVGVFLIAMLGGMAIYRLFLRDKFVS